MSVESYLVMGVCFLFFFSSDFSFRQEINKLIIKQLRGARIPQIPRAARKDPALDRRQDEPARQTTALCVGRSEDVRPIWRPAYHNAGFGSG